MNIAVILAGGVGTRMGHNIPKQYILVEDKPVLLYTLESFQACADVDRIIIVADQVWREQILEWVGQYGITKFLDFADPGATRQDSVFSGLTQCKKHTANEDDIAVVHDGVRAMITPQLIHDLIAGLEGYDGCIPVVPLKDAVFFSETGDTIDSLVDRNKLFCGQSPECFYLLPYWEINNRMSAQERSKVLADHELAFQCGWRVHVHPGNENNFKLTTPSDIERMINLIRAGQA